jgi:hypothetical protein
MERRTKVAKAVFPLPLGPMSRNVGSFVASPACLYKRLCSSIGSTSATTSVMRMVLRLGENAAVSQLSLSCHAMLQFGEKGVSGTKSRRRDV